MVMSAISTLSGTINQMAKRSIMAQLVQFLRHVVPAVLRPLRTLWHEIIGFLFVVLAMWAVPSGVRTIREFNGDLGSVFKVILIGCFILIMGGYGISSFRRARRISRP